MADIGQLVSVNRDLVVTEYQYRPDNLRHSKTTDGQQTVHYWDGQNMVLETNGQGITKATYLRGQNLIAQVIDLSLFFYLMNAHGDVVQRVATQGHATPFYEYDSFGNLREHPELYDPDKDPNPFRYCGEYWKGNTAGYSLSTRK